MGDSGEEDNGVVTESGVTSFSQLLLSDGVIDDVGDAVLSCDHRRDDGGDTFGFGFSAKGGPRMLCFGGAYRNDAELLFPDPAASPRVTSCSESNSTVSSCSNTKNKNSSRTVEKSSRSSKKRNGSGDNPDRVRSMKTVLGNPDCDRGIGKKSKTDHTKSPIGKAKVRKERLGERITALQQLVSPYGKTDTASVLHEAMGYIKFLQDQVQVLCSPYLIRHPHDGGEVGDEELTKKDLRSRGLCLVPVSCTVNVANTNGADFWSPAMGHSMLASMNQ